MSVRRWVVFGALVLAIGLLDVFVISHWAIVHALIEPIVMTVIIVTLLNGPSIGLIVAVALGYLLSLSSVLPFGTHSLALVATAGLCSMLVRRVVAGRAVASFVATIILGTVVYYGLLTGSSWLSHWVFHTTYTMPLTNVFITTVLQSVMHALVLVTIWRILRRDQFHHIRETMYQSF